MPPTLEAATAFRQPRPPAPIEPFEIPHSSLPAALDGLTILHISDLHSRTPQWGRRWFRSMLEGLRRTPADIVAFTGDYMDSPPNARSALKALSAVVDAIRPRLGAFGIFGNHDTTPFMRAARRRLAKVRWLDGEHVDVQHRGVPLRILGAHWPEDLLSAALQTPETAAAPVAGAGGSDPADHPPSARDPFTITLAHIPTALITAASMNLPLVLAGHTHAGQIRLSPRLAPHTSSDLPAHLATGVLRLRGTLCCVSRGTGEAIMERLRINCPRHVPLYTLRRGELPRPPEGGSPDCVTQVIPW